VKRGKAKQQGQEDREGTYAMKDPVLVEVLQAKKTLQHKSFGIRLGQCQRFVLDNHLWREGCVWEKACGSLLCVLCFLCECSDHTLLLPAGE
jgi:hypothetical protein